MQQVGKHSTPKHVMQHFKFTSDKIFKIFKERLMRPGFALVVEVSRFLGASLGSPSTSTYELLPWGSLH
jgi:hypothetical protein